VDRALLDALRCPAPHAEEWLVAMVHQADGPRLIEADLACPACGAAFGLQAAVAWFRASSVQDSAVERTPRAATGSAPAAAWETNDPDADRLAALLGVAEGPWPVVLVGARAAAGAALAAIVSPPQWWINPDPVALGNAPHPTWLAAVLHIGPRWPLAARQAAAVALDATHATPAQLAEAVRVLRSGGRLVAPAWAPLPEGVRELARDATEWVAEATGSVRAEGDGPLVPIRRRSS
jgi:uncharacterized protein YbaR (Trm112 family)